MQIKLNKINVDLNIDQIKRSQISFTALHGRRLNIQLADASWMKNISLNHLIEAVRTTAENQTQDSREIKDFLTFLMR
ncbi:MAG: hypothetical protein HWD61_15765 [Parachlamydiaceae bacterium]|nr:MAG: hypothetical protein HWD61_15765 [Parachlamydiaceae bacterium]